MDLNSEYPIVYVVQLVSTGQVLNHFDLLTKAKEYAKNIKQPVTICRRQFVCFGN